MSEKTLANSNQALTLAGRILSALSPTTIDSQTAQFWIDNPGALKYRMATLGKRPTVVQVLGYRLGPARGLATLIESWWSEKFDVWGIDHTLLAESQKFDIHPCADIVVVDTHGLYADVLERRAKLAEYEQFHVVFVNDESKLATVEQRHVDSCKDNNAALELIMKWQITRITAPLYARKAEFERP